MEKLSRATRAGADYLLSLSEKNIAIVDEGPGTPILVSVSAAALESLERAIDLMIARGRPYYADPIGIKADDRLCRFQDDLGALAARRIQSRVGCQSCVGLGASP